jgi:hypothetical protein
MLLFICAHIDSLSCVNIQKFLQETWHIDDHRFNAWLAAQLKNDRVTYSALHSVVALLDVCLTLALLVAHPSFCLQSAAGGISGFSVKTASGKAFKFGSTACANSADITANICTSPAVAAITSMGFSTRTDGTLNLIALGPGCPNLATNPVVTKPLCIECPAGNRVAAVAGWWDATAKLVNGLEVTCSNGARLVSGLRSGAASRVIIPEGELLSEVSCSNPY